MKIQAYYSYEKFKKSREAIVNKAHSWHSRTSVTDENVLSVCRLTNFASRMLFSTVRMLDSIRMFELNKNLKKCA